MSVIPLNSQYSNISSFVNSLYSSGVRTPQVIFDAIGDQVTSTGFSKDGDMITKVWLAAWQEGQNDSSYNKADYSNCPISDRKIIAFLASYLKKNALSMFVPQINYLESTQEGPQYQLASYKEFDFLRGGQWQWSVVQDFLNLLLYGAHFVIIQADPNLPGVSSLWDDFKNDPSIDTSERRDESGDILGNSHYTSTTNKNGWYYPNIRTDQAPDPSPFILSLLVCPTVSRLGGPNGPYDTFMQLEGWELPPDLFKVSGSRHDSDFQLYNQTYWNISTYGACAYSEKRATAVFLAPPAWDPKPVAGTFMPPYVGAETAQGWLKTELVSLKPEIGSTGDPNKTRPIYITVDNNTGADLVVTHIDMQDGIIVQNLPGIISNGSTKTFEASCTDSASPGPQGTIYFNSDFQISFEHPHYGIGSKTSLVASYPIGYEAVVDNSGLQHHTARGSVTFQKNKE